MKDTHLIIALYRALDRYGSSAVPADDRPRSEQRRPVGWPEERRRRPGWVSVAEVEASQSPNTYPRLTRRAIRARCEALAGQSGSPVQGIAKGPGGMRTWVLVEPPGKAPGGAGRTDERAGEESRRDAADAERGPDEADAAEIATDDALRLRPRMAAGSA